MLTIGAIACYKANCVISKAERLKTELPDTYSPRWNEVIQAFIIPFKIEEELLENNLDIIDIPSQGGYVIVSLITDASLIRGQ